MSPRSWHVSADEVVAMDALLDLLLHSYLLFTLFPHSLSFWALILLSLSSHLHLTILFHSFHHRVLLAKDGTNAARREAVAPSFARSASLNLVVLLP